MNLDSANTMYTARILSGGIQIIEELAPEWTALCDRSKCSDPYLRPDWFISLVRNFRTEVRLVTVRRNGSLRAVLPLVAQKATIHGLRVAALQGVFNLNTPRFDLVHSGDESERRAIVDALWMAMQELDRWDAFEARLVKSDSWLTDLLKRAQADQHPTGVWQMDAAPFITLPTRADAGRFFAGQRKHFGKEMDRRIRRLNEVGKVEFLRTHEYSATLIRRYLELEQMGWKGNGGTAAILDTKAASLHHDLARDVAKNGRLHVYELRLDGRTIAMSLNIRDGSTMFHWKTSYDESFSKYSPGNLLFRKLFDDCVVDGLTEIDFLSPSTANKRAWATGEREHVAFYIFRPGVIGRVVWAWKFAVVARLRAMRDSYPRVASLFLWMQFQ